MSSSLSDILTAAKNIASAINGLSNTNMYLAGKSTSSVLSVGAHQITVGQGWVARLAVAETGGGSAQIELFDASSLSTTLGNGLISVTISTDGFVDVRLPFYLGLVAVIPAGAKIRLSYSLNQDVR